MLVSDNCPPQRLCVLTFQATIYTQLGFDTQRALLINLLLGAMGFLFSGMWVLLVDRFPRKKLLIFTTLMMGAALLVQSVLSAVYAGKDAANKNALNAQVAMFFVFKLFFNAVGFVEFFERLEHPLTSNIACWLG